MKMYLLVLVRTVALLRISVQYVCILMLMHALLLLLLLITVYIFHSKITFYFLSFTVYPGPFSQKYVLHIIYIIYAKKHTLSSFSFKLLELL